jgi:PAS domain S-box-containing protein
MKPDLLEQITKLQATLGKMEIALSSISDAIVWTDHRGHIEWCNSTFNNLLNQSRIDILGKPVVDIFPLIEHGTLLPKKAHPVSIILKKKIDVNGFFEYARSGQYSYLELIGHYLEIPNFDKISVLVIRDITHIKDIEQIRLQSAALHHAANSIVITDRKGKVNWVNHSFTKLTGYTLKEVYGQNLRILKSGEHDNTFYRHLWETILSGHVWEGEIVNRKKDGSTYSEEQTIAPVKNKDGRISNFIAIKHDVTERRKIEKELSKYHNELEEMVEKQTLELREAQEELINKAMEAGIAQAASMSLHNIGNAITPLNVLLETMQTSESGKISHYLEKCYDDIKEHADDLEHYINQDARGKQVFAYMGDLIHSLTDLNKERTDSFHKMKGALSHISEILSLQETYTAMNHEIKELVDLNSSIDDAIGIQTGSLDQRRIFVKKQFDDNLPKILVDKNRLLQVIVNFIKNSYEAIDAKKNNTDPKEIVLKSFVENDRVVFQISDNGIGIDPEQIDKIFEFGKSGKGSTGFGLHYCKRFVEANDGSITLKSDGIGRGTTVAVYFNSSGAKGQQ